MTAPEIDRRCRVDAEDLIGLRACVQPLRPAAAPRARSVPAGAHGSRLHGRGVDYRESRHYQPGDDIRNMDWRITARAGRPHVKVFDEERERPVVVLVDLGPRMFFASRGVFKSVLAARLAALIGWSAVAHGDRIGALLCGGQSGGVHSELAPAGGRRGQMRLIRALVAHGDPSAMVAPALGEDPAAAALSEALVRLRRVAKPGSRVFLLSDFAGLDAALAPHLARLAEHSELSALQIVDPLELAPPPPGRYPVSDGSALRVLDLRSRAARSRYQAHFGARDERLRALTAGHGIALQRCRTSDDPRACLDALFGLRRAGAPRGPRRKAQTRGRGGASRAWSRSPR